MNYRIYFILITLFLSSCQTTMKMEYNKFISHKISIPDGLQVLHHDGSISSLDSSEKVLRMIIYTDSAYCNTCNMKSLPKWNALIKYAEMFDDKLKYYYIFSPKHDETQHVRLAYLSSQFNHPIIIDSASRFRASNKYMPHNRNMHMFLLDPNNNIIMVGNPLVSHDLEALFRKTVENHIPN